MHRLGHRRFNLYPCYLISDFWPSWLNAARWCWKLLAESPSPPPAPPAILPWHLTLNRKFWSKFTAPFSFVHPSIENRRFFAHFKGFFRFWFKVFDDTSGLFWFSLLTDVFKGVSPLICRRFERILRDWKTLAGNAARQTIPGDSGPILERLRYSKEKQSKEKKNDEEIIARGGERSDETNEEEREWEMRRRRRRRRRKRESKLGENDGRYGAARKLIKRQKQVTCSVVYRRWLSPSTALSSKTTFAIFVGYPRPVLLPSYATYSIKQLGTTTVTQWLML